ERGNNMKLIKYFIVLPILFFISCGNQSEQAQQKTEDIPVNSEEINNSNEEGEITKSYKTDESSGKDQKNRPPTIEEISIETISSNPRDGFKAVTTAADPEGDLVDFIYQWKYDDEDIIGETSQTLAWQEDFKRGGVISIEVIPYDNYAQGIWKSEGTLTIPNSPPIIESIPPKELENGKLSYEIKASDPDGDNIKISLNNAPDGVSLNEESKLLEWDINDANAGEYKFEIVVSDEQGGATTQILDLTVNQPG
ncbi:MAG: Ig domain-containing protein, partial [Thermodesulfobacteriota bacterium]